MLIIYVVQCVRCTTPILTLPPSAYSAPGTLGLLSRVLSPEDDISLVRGSKT